MKERLICAVMILPAIYFCSFEFKSKKIENVLRVISGVLLMLLAFYLGTVLPQ